MRSINYLENYLLENLRKKCKDRIPYQSPFQPSTLYQATKFWTGSK